MTAEHNPEIAQVERARAARWTAWTALAFCAVVLALMLVNAIQARSVHPIEARSLEALQHELLLRPDDEQLRARVRREDVRIRREYFRHRDFALRGAWLLLAGIVVFLAASEAARRAQYSPPEPRSDAAVRARASAEATFRAVAALGGALGGLLLTMAVLARHDTVAEYVRAAAKGPILPPPGRTAAQAGPDKPGGAVGLPVAGLQASQGGTQDAIPTPEGSRLSGPGTLMTPVAEGSTSGAPSAGASLLAGKPLPSVVPVMPPGWDANWPRFRGPAGTGEARKAQPPLRWDAQTGLGVLWKTPIPLPGWNSPIVWGDRIFVSGADDRRREVYCLSLQTGAIQWRTSVPYSAGAPAPKVLAATGYAPSTLATDGQRVVAVFVNGDVFCLDMEGKIIWQRSLGPLENQYGHASSPIIFGSGVILQLDQGHSAEDGKSALLALDLASGKTVWQIKRPVGATWSTPIIALVDGKEQLITTASPWVIAYDPHDGRELWRADCLGGEVAVSPVLGKGYVLVANQGSNSAAIRPDGRGDVSKTAVAWTGGDGLPDIVSPLVFDDLMLLVTTEGYLTCVDVKTGKVVWQHDVEATIRASPVLVGDRIYLTDASGVTRILKTGHSYQELGRCPIGEEVNATPAFVGTRVVIRGKSSVYCVGER